MGIMDLSRFTEAHRTDYHTALAEIKNGRKQTHWMWYIFPQIHGLGKSSTSEYYAIKSLEEAKAFLEDPYLGGNLVEICNVLLNLDENDPLKIFDKTDDKKLKSCMTLFAMADKKGDVFKRVLEKYYNGKMDKKTLMILGI